MRKETVKTYMLVKDEVVIFLRTLSYLMFKIDISRILNIARLTIDPDLNVFNDEYKLLGKVEVIHLTIDQLNMLKEISEKGSING